MGLCVNHVAGLPSFRLMAPHSGLCADYRARKSVVKMKQVPRREGEAGGCRVMKRMVNAGVMTYTVRSMQQLPNSDQKLDNICET